MARANPNSRVRGVCFINGDLAIYALYQLRVYRNEEIGRVTAAVKRARKYLKENSRVEKIIKKPLNDK